MMPWFGGAVCFISYIVCVDHNASRRFFETVRRDGRQPTTFKPGPLRRVAADVSGPVVLYAVGDSVTL